VLRCGGRYIDFLSGFFVAEKFKKITKKKLVLEGKKNQLSPQ
jgi:hypothetical protein